MLVKVLIDNLSENDLAAEWGLSFYIEYGDRKLLLDTGAGANFAENAKKLGIDLGEVDFAVLSHAHYDHADGMPAFFAVNDRAKFYVRKGASENCYGKKRFFYKYNGIAKGTLAAYADRIVYAEGDHKLAEGIYLIPHKTTGLEKIAKKADLYVRENGRWYPDDFAHEQSLVFRTPKGLVIFNSCSHGGADNIIREVADTFPGEKVYALIGGFHLYKAAEEDIRAFAERLRELDIQKLVTGHCTGEAPFRILKEVLGSRIGQMYAGMKIEI